jgi:hypothetical protein
MPEFAPGTEPFYDADGDFLALATDGNYYFIDPAAYEAEVEQIVAQEEWVEEGGRNGDLLEHRLGRELTDAERQTIADDMVRGGHADAFNAYDANYSADRTRDTQDRLDLMAEYMDEASAEEPDETTEEG